jgi:hypothetical protein
MTRNAALIIGSSVFALAACCQASPAPAHSRLPGAAIFQDGGAPNPGTDPGTGAPAGDSPGTGAPAGDSPGSDNSGDGADTAADPHWHPNTALLRGLTHAAKVGPYSLSVPGGMPVKKIPYQDQHLIGAMYEWMGTKRSPYPGLVILAGVVRCRPGYTLETIGTEQMDLLDAIEAQFDSQEDVTKSDKQEGDVSGMTATRNYYKFTSTKSGIREHGFNYVANTDNVIVVVGGMAPEPFNAKELAFAEALSLRFLQTVAKRK